MNRNKLFLMFIMPWFFAFLLGWLAGEGISFGVGCASQGNCVQPAGPVGGGGGGGWGGDGPSTYPNNARRR